MYLIKLFLIFLLFFIININVEAKVLNIQLLIDVFGQDYYERKVIQLNEYEIT